MATPALIKRYNKLVGKLQQWQPVAETESLVSAHQQVLNELPADATNDENIMEEYLKKVEGFFRQVQVAQGLGREDTAENTKKSGKAKNPEKNNSNHAATSASSAVAAPKATKTEQPAKSASAAVNKEKYEEHKEPSASIPKVLPAYIQHRIAVWDRIAQRQAAASPLSGSPITVTLPDGKQLPATSGITTPHDIAKQISSQSADRWVVAMVDDNKWDIHRPLVKDCHLSLYDFDSKEGSYAFWHSSAHLLGQAVELQYKDVKLCVGPPVDDGGFYYDVEMGDQKISTTEFSQLEAVVEKIIKEKQPFIRLELKKEEALEMFEYNPFKKEIISSKVPDGGICTAYRCGPLIDLCKGPHVPNSSYIKALAVTKASSAYWLGKAENASLQRIYGISFPDKKKLAAWQEFQRQAEERDHRRIGQQQKLFFFHEWSPGSCFFLPHGTRIYNKLIQFIRSEYAKRAYTEVLSPNVFNIELWKKSGHYDNYRENMFEFECEHQAYALKPMNCPGHCLMYANTIHSYRDLPLRYADFGVLHRNEISGALTGLTRVRRFQQDDAHIFARPDQIQTEVRGVLDMLESVYGVFGFKYHLALSTRPEKYLGQIEVWNEAEKQLEECLNSFIKEKNTKDEERWREQQQEKSKEEEKKDHTNPMLPIKEHHDRFIPMTWTVNPGDGAFYGPKIDIQLTDALNRRHQCATIQLDFQLPIRFDLHYKNEQGELIRPVIIHRAILGSVERMMAVLIEHTAGKWPFWISPRQIQIVPVTDDQLPYAHTLQQQLIQHQFYVDIDTNSNTLNKKIREAQIEQYNLILVIGAKEVNEQTVTIRWRDEPEKRVTESIDEVITYCHSLVKEYK